MSDQQPPRQHPQDVVNRINAIAGTRNENRWEDIERQILMAQEEFNNELLRDLKARDRLKLRDSLADVLVFLFGVASVSDIDVAADFTVVTDALLSRFDSDMANAMITHRQYADRGVETSIRKTEIDGVDYFVNFSVKDQTANSGEFIKEGKWLKSHKYHNPVLV